MFLSVILPHYIASTDLHQGIENQQRNNDDEKRGCGHNDDNQGGYHTQKGEDEGTEDARNDLIDDVSVFRETVQDSSQGGRVEEGHGRAKEVLEHGVVEGF